MATALGCGGAGGYVQRRSEPAVTSTRVGITDVSRAGIRLALEAGCESEIVNVECIHQAAGPADCQATPTGRKEAVPCPRELDFKSTPISLRTPWGGIYRATSDEQGFVELPVDWSGTGVDPLAAGVAAQLATGWLGYTDAGRSMPLKLEPSHIERVLTLIGAATDTQHEVGAANEKAALTAELAEASPLLLGRSGTISLAITNGGPQPAYRVIAKLRSSVDALHGHQLSFGRIDPGKTKTKTRVVALPPKLEDRSALVVAEISYFNGDPLETKKRFNIMLEPKRAEVKRGLAVDCKLGSAEVAPGERVRIDCELRNVGNEPASELTATVSVGGVISKNVAPKSLPGAGSAKLELVGLTSAKEKQGTEVPVVIRVTAPGLPAVERTLSVRIASFATKCSKRLTRDEYKAKRKRLQAALDTGALTQKEFDKYDADLVSCLQ